MAEMKLRLADLSAVGRGAIGSLATLANVRSSFIRLRGSRRAVPCRGSCGGGRRVRRLHCGARLGVAPQNSLRSLCSLHSNNCGKSVFEARKRADPKPPLLVAPEIAPAGYRPPRAGRVLAFPPNTTSGSAKARPGRWQRASEALRSTGLLARARSALRRLTCRRLFEGSERSERSEFGDGPGDRAPEGSRRTRRPPQRSADACPGAPLPRGRCISGIAMPQALAKRS